VVGLGEDEAYELLEVAVMARLIIESRPGWFEFSHGLVRDTLYRDLRLGRRARLHARVADAIEVVHGDDLQPFVGRLAYHAAAAHDASRTVRYARLAAEQAERTSSFDEAVRFWEQALSAHDGVAARPRASGASGERARLLLRLGAAHRGAGDTTACAAALDQALEAADEADDLVLLGEAALAYGEMGLWQAPPYGTVDATVVRAIERALEGTAEDDLVFRARLLTGLAVATYYDDTARDRSRRLAREAVVVARAAGDPQVRANALVELIMTLDGAPDLTEERAVAEELRSVLAAAQEITFEVAAPARMRLTRLRFMGGDGTNLDREVARATQQAIEARHEVVRLWALWAETGVAVMRGRLAEAERLAGTAFELHQRLGLWGAPETYALHMVPVWREQDRLAEVEPLVREPMEASEHPGARKLWGVFLLEAGDVEGVAALLGDDPVPRPRDWTWLAEICVTAELAAAAGSPCREELYAILARLDPRIVVMDGPWACYGATSHYLGLLAASLGRPAIAIGHMEDAVRLHDRAGAVLWSVRSRFHLAAALGDDARAELAASAAREMATAHGLVRLQRGLHDLAGAREGKQRSISSTAP
jgi:tetratricopeptide (TPR) repeat protein